jgi:hypothetical protein
MLDPGKVGPRWDVRRESKCQAAWCATAGASKDELEMEPVYEPMTQ